MVLEALKFMVLGMGIVFLFLLVLIWAIDIQAKLIAKYFPKEEQKAQNVTSSNTTSAGISKKTVAAIVGALTEHKKNS